MPDLPTINDWNAWDLFPDVPKPLQDVDVILRKSKSVSSWATHRLVVLNDTNKSIDTATWPLVYNLTLYSGVWEIHTTPNYWPYWIFLRDTVPTIYSSKLLDIAQTRADLVALFEKQLRLRITFHQKLTPALAKKHGITSVNNKKRST